MLQSIPKQFDYVVVGSGIAGLFAALTAKEHGSVALLSKGSLEDCNSLFAQGGVAAAVGPDDSPTLHLDDTIMAGAGLVDVEAARVLVTEGPERIADLASLGMAFDVLDGRVALAREGAHGRARVLHAGGDATGARMERTLVERVRDSRVVIVEHALLTRVRVDPATGAAAGVDAVHTQTGEPLWIAARHVVLATGGAGQLFRYTTNPAVATGDGVAVAFRAGAQLRDVEFYQFHPTALHVPGAPPFLISEAVRGEGGVLRNADGEAFMTRYDAQGDLAGRDIVARAIVREMERTGATHVSLDVTHLPAAHVRARFPTIYQTCLTYGVDPTRQPIPVAPAAHYMMGGVKTNLWGETSVAGLYACGELASTGVHGANRLASNSLLETLVFSKRAIDRTLGRVDDAPASEGLAECVAHVAPRPAVDGPPPSRDALQQVMWEGVGISRDAARLEGAARMLGGWAGRTGPPHDREAHELANMALVGWLMAEAALLRTESRGAHYRTDFPLPSNDWACHLTLAPGE